MFGCLSRAITSASARNRRSCAGAVNVVSLTILIATRRLSRRSSALNTTPHPTPAQLIEDLIPVDRLRRRRRQGSGGRRTRTRGGRRKVIALHGRTVSRPQGLVHGELADRARRPRRGSAEGSPPGAVIHPGPAESRTPGRSHRGLPRRPSSRVGCRARKSLDRRALSMLPTRLPARRGSPRTGAGRLAALVRHPSSDRRPFEIRPSLSRPSGVEHVVELRMIPDPLERPRQLLAEALGRATHREGDRRPRLIVEPSDQ